MESHIPCGAMCLRAGFGRLFRLICSVSLIPSTLSRLLCPHFGFAEWRHTCQRHRGLPAAALKCLSRKCRSLETSLYRIPTYDGSLPETKTCPAIYRSRLALAAEISEIPEDYGHIVTARTHDEPYSMWRRGSMLPSPRISPTQVPPLNI